MAGKCPKCENLVTAVNFNDLTASSIGVGGQWDAMTYQCPMCSTILGCQIDPVALKNDIVREVLEKLQQV